MRVSVRACLCGFQLGRVLPALHRQGGGLPWNVHVRLHGHGVPVLPRGPRQLLLLRGLRVWYAARFPAFPLPRSRRNAAIGLVVSRMIVSAAQTFTTRTTASTTAERSRRSNEKEDVVEGVVGGGDLTKGRPRMHFWVDGASACIHETFIVMSRPTAASAATVAGQARAQRLRCCHRQQPPRADCRRRPAASPQPTRTIPPPPPPTEPHWLAWRTSQLRLQQLAWLWPARCRRHRKRRGRTRTCAANPKAVFNSGGCGGRRTHGRGRGARHRTHPIGIEKIIKSGLAWCRSLWPYVDCATNDRSIVVSEQSSQPRGSRQATTPADIGAVGETRRAPPKSTRQILSSPTPSST